MMNQERLRMSEDPLVGHRNWVTALAVCRDPACKPEATRRDLLLTASRDKTVLIWELYNGCREASRPRASLRGHNGFVNDVACSASGRFAATASDDKTVRVWDLIERKTIKILSGHSADVLCVAFIGDAMVVSGSRDGSIKVWGIDGSLLCTFERAHDSWVTGVKALESNGEPIIVSCGWDKRVKVWDLKQRKLQQSHIGDTGCVQAVAVSQDGSICATGGNLGTIFLWDLTDQKFCFSIETGERIYALSFSPERYWLCAATQNGVKIWDISIGGKLLENIVLEVPNRQHSERTIEPTPLSLRWSDEGNTLFVGYTDNTVRMLQMC